MTIFLPIVAIIVIKCLKMIIDKFVRNKTVVTNLVIFLIKEKTRIF